MQQLRELIQSITQRLQNLAKANAVVAKPVSVGGRHAVALCELSLGLGAGGGIGEGNSHGQGTGKGLGVGSGGGAKAAPVAVLVVEDGKVKLQNL